MIPALYAAATGLMTVEDRQSVIANNIANASTAGFKSQRPLQKGFYQVFLDKMRDPTRLNLEEAPGGGVKMIETFSNYASGVMTTTDNPLHIALQGPGFIGVDTPQGERFTRQGQLSIDSQGNLTTKDGFQIQDIGGGPINVSGGIPEVGEEGHVTVNGQTVGQIRIVEFEDPHTLTRQGHTLLAASPSSQMLPESGTRVANGSLEMSNVQLPREMVSMMMALRAYEANQRVIHSVNETVSRAIDQVGSPI